ncbi:PTAC2 [Symbiodinium microadriaticum]|nr:PTAC2 [Symbiodinium microadriaticum]
MVGRDAWMAELQFPFGIARRTGTAENTAPDLFTYSSALRAFEPKGLWQLSLSLLASMQKDSVDPKPICYRSVISACEQSSNWEVALCLLAFHEGDVMGYSAAISATAKAAQWRAALFLLGVGMPTAKVNPNVISYNAAMSACEKCSQWQLALHLLGLLPAAGLQPTVVSFSSVSSAFEKSGEWSLALHLLSEMPEQAAQPNVITYSSVITACAAGSQWQLALLVFSTIHLQNLAVDEISCNSAITACEKAGHWTRALALLHGMSAMELERSVVSWSSAVSACENAEQWQAAFALLDGMLRAGTRPNTLTLNSAISACEKSSLWQKSLQLLFGMREMSLQADGVTFNAAVLACSRSRQWQETLWLFADMQASRVEPEALTFSYVLMNCEQFGLVSHEVVVLASLRDVHGRRIVAQSSLEGKSFASLRMPGPYAASLSASGKVHAAGITFHANQQDGFFYGRPGFAGNQVELFQKHQVGDLRVRFLCTPESDATVVAVQCQKDKLETFVPYRVVPQAPCDDERQERLKLVEEGDKTWREVRRDGNCCTGGVATCCCCPCNTLACLTSQEVVTEEIFYVSDSMDPPEKPFRRAVSRNPWLLWNWRLLGWLLMYFSLHFALPVLDNVFEGLGLQRLPTAVNMLMLTLVLWSLVVAATRLDL